MEQPSIQLQKDDELGFPEAQKTKTDCCYQSLMAEENSSMNTAAVLDLPSGLDD